MTSEIDTLSATDPDYEHHGPSDARYILIAACLAGITAVEVWLSYTDIGVLFLPALLVLMAVKFFAVVSLFMHLWFDNKIFSVLFYMGLTLALGVYPAALATFHFFSS